MKKFRNNFKEDCFCKMASIPAIVNQMQHTVLNHHIAQGISLVLVPLSNTAAVTTIVLMEVGSRHENNQQQGLAHFTEHMVFKGGKHYPNSQALSQALDAVGGEFNAFTAQEFTGFYTKTAGEHLELGLDVLSDIILHATFPDDELVKEKGVIVEELNMYEDIPMRKVDQVLMELVYGDTPIGRAIVGTKKSVTAFTRDDFVHYREEFYKAGGCTIVIAGAFDPEATKTLVTRYFAELPAGELPKPEAARIKATDKRVVVEHKKSEQTHLLLSVNGYPIEHPKKYAYRLLSTILGGNMSSRLFVSVREKQGLCYYVRVSPDSYVDTGLLVAAAGVDNNRLTQATEAIMQEYRLIREKGVEDVELDRAKEYLIGKTKLSLEDSEQVAEFYGVQNLLEKKFTSLEKIETAVRAVTKEQVKEVAQELFIDENLRMAVIGPQENEKELEKILSFGF